MMIIHVDGVRVCIENYQPFVQGTVGLQANVQLSEEWDGLTVTAVFATADNFDTRYPVSAGSGTITVPWEVLSEAKAHPLLSFDGRDSGGNLIRRSSICDLGEVAPSLDPLGETPTPTPPYPDWYENVFEAGQQALQSAQDAEAYAKGTRGGTEVGTTDPTYHNNAKYFKEQAEVIKDSIPEDYTELVGEVGELKSAFESDYNVQGYPDQINASNYAEKLPDLNNAEPNRIYAINQCFQSIAHIPGDSAIASATVMTFTKGTYNNKTWYIQFVVGLGNKFFYRSCWSGSWSNWGKVATDTLDCSTLFQNGYRFTKDGVIGDFVANAGYVSCVLNVSPGDKFIVTGLGSKNARTWAFADSSKTITRTADTSEVTNVTLTAVDGEAYFLYNDSTSAPASLLKLKIDSIAVLEKIRADIVKNAEDISKLDGELNTFDCSTLLQDGYRLTNSGVIGDFTANAAYKSCLLHVLPGDVLTVSGQGSNNARTWAFADSSKKITRTADTSAVTNVTLTAANGEAYFVYNDVASAASAYALSITTNRLETIENIRNSIDLLNEKAKAVSIKNDLKTDGISNLKPYNVSVTQNGSTSDAKYGVDGAKYMIDLGDYSRCHIRFYYCDPQYRVYSGSNVFVPIMSMGVNDALLFESLYKGVTSKSGLIYREAWNIVENGRTRIGYNIDTDYKKPLNGSMSIALTYTGNTTIDGTTAITATFASDAVTFSVNGTDVDTVSIDPTDTIQEFADAINDVAGFTCTVYNANGTVSDLLLPTNGTYSFVDSVTRGGQTVYGTNAIIISFNTDNSWHLCEVIVDRTAQKAALAYDGYTKEVKFSDAELEDGIVVIGGSYANESGVKVKDLEIDIDTYADCELITGHITNASTRNTAQLISDKSPRLMIFEGHGVFAGTEAAAYAAYQASGSTSSQEGMAVSTERLEIIFNELNARGYKFVTMNDVLEWKKGNKHLPKRCFSMVFDDYRVENFIDYNCRRPFVKHNIKPSLAMISNLHALTDTLSINGTTYTVSDALDIVDFNEWFMCSHTKDHRNLRQYTYGELEELLKEDVLSCDAHKMHGNVLVFPYGAITSTGLHAIAMSDFAIAISVVEENYNCMAMSDYRFARTEIGTRETLTNVLSPFI